MNIVLLMAGGIGKRFGGTIPKQYNMIAGRPVIDYVLDAAFESKLTDQVVVAMDEQWKDYADGLNDPSIDFAKNGETRYETMLSGLQIIKQKYPCEKVVILDAVAPFVTGRIIDDYFEKLNQYDAVITAQKITGALTDKNNARLNREDYIITQSPEGFRFDLLWNNFDVSFPYQETAGMLPDGASRLYNYEFRNNLKITYDFELYYAEFLLKNLGRIDQNEQIAHFDKSLLMTEGLKNFFLRFRKEETLQWVDHIYSVLPDLIAKWKITSFIPNQISRYGLVLQATTQDRGDIILKFTPEFIGRFEREAEAYKYLPKTYMCELIDVDQENRCLILKKIKPARYASFEENLKLTSLYEQAVGGAVKYQGQNLEHIDYYEKELKRRCDDTSELRFCDKEIKDELKNAWELYQREFKDADLYVLHGDLIDLNVLDDGERFYAVDPIGFLAPLEFECVRFIRNDVRNHPEFGFNHRFNLLIDSFSRFVDKKRLIEFFIIDMAYCTYNSVFENDDSRETETNLELIRIAKKELQTYAGRD